MHPSNLELAKKPAFELSKLTKILSELQDNSSKNRNGKVIFFSDAAYDEYGSSKKFVFPEMDSALRALMCIEVRSDIEKQKQLFNEIDAATEPLEEPLM